jgi:hypothetical protein
MVWLRKYVPWLLSNMRGHPNLVTTFANRNCVVVYAMKLENGVASTHLVKYLVGVMMKLAPDVLACGLMGPTKSIALLSNACNITCGFNGISPH